MPARHLGHSLLPKQTLNASDNRMLLAIGGSGGGRCRETVPMKKNVSRFT
jgi:hypothetical protein